MRSLYILTDGMGYVAYLSHTKKYVARTVEWVKGSTRLQVTWECFETSLEDACGTLHKMDDERRRAA